MSSKAHPHRNIHIHIDICTVTYFQIVGTTNTKTTKAADTKGSNIVGVVVAVTCLCVI